MAVRLDTTPFWTHSTSLPACPRLQHDEVADVVVVGGGITGLTTAYLLAMEDRSVVVLERHRCAQIDSGHTTAHLTMVTDLPMSDLVKQFGRDHARAVWDAGLAAIAQIDAVVRAEGIACDFAWVPGYLHAAAERAADDTPWLSNEARVVGDLGFDATFVDDVPLVHQPGVKFERQARFHPRKYLAGLMRAISARGGRIYEESEAKEFSKEPRFVKANGCTVSCGDVVLATHTPRLGNDSVLSATLFQTKLALYSTYAVGGRVPKGSVPDALLWDTSDPYHYFRITPEEDHDLVIYGGEDHKTGQADDTTACYARLSQKLNELIPGMKITHRWSGQVVETHDGLPFIGETADHQFAGSGYAGNGMTFGTLTAMMVRDQLQGRQNPWRDLFHPERKTLRGGAWDYIRENKDYAYYLARDRVAGAEGSSLQEVVSGDGMIIDYKGKKVAASRDESGALALVSAVCTHMGCQVAWNPAERTWDCPCHGSRFMTSGDVIGGPAESPLAKVAPE
jgi:glycine/D-amino acid oxidase-like deaminating enzyme/nitrite reductase/ring-hydroxylating ferredoxin subunit